MEGAGGAGVGERGNDVEVGRVLWFGDWRMMSGDESRWQFGWRALGFVVVWLAAEIGAVTFARGGEGVGRIERLDRGTVVVGREDGSCLVGWRLLATDPRDAGFDVYRSDGSAPATRINAQPLTGPTQFVVSANDAAAGGAGKFQVVPSGGRASVEDAAWVAPWPADRPWLSIPLRTPEGYRPNDASVGDLDGDGRYEIVLHQVGRGRDNSQSGATSEPILQAYRLDGTFLWEINLGRNIREGAHYTQFMVFDLDGDGRAEIACKTADGTIDGIGRVIGNANADHRNARGYILDGPEFLTVFDGATGAEIDTVPYVPPRGEVASWGDEYGNRVDRFLACVAWLDGGRPSLVMCRGYYTRCVLAAWDFRGRELVHRWTFDSDDGTPGNELFRGQGNHGIGVADVDDDGRDEIVYGSCVIDDDGSGLYATGFGHGDAMHLTDIDPEDVFNKKK